MKKMIPAGLLILAVLSVGCVRRTITEEPTFVNPATKERYSGDHTKIVDQKTVWFWQKEFRNP
ncbi:MAG: hypothetical protein JXR25_12770 [Pontiellaceae bacterium]|nr:hypothetical protein [Pontiellaceae bacterium]MBN2785690.1 hypothetical protein [Pontiellaceae bacterium]